MGPFFQLSRCFAVVFGGGVFGGGVGCFSVACRSYPRGARMRCGLQTEQWRLADQIH